MADRILDDKSLHALGVCQCDAKADRSTVVLHVERVMRETECLREAVHHGGDVVEGVVELLRVGPVAVPVARIIGRDQMVAVCEPRQERLKHPRG